MKKYFIFAALFDTSVSAQEADTRKVLDLNETQRNHVLTEMRSLLSAVQGITEALAKDDMATVAESAKAVGFNMKHKAENDLHQVLPHEFMTLGMSMHKDFDVIAADAVSKKDAKHTLKQLGDVLGKCTACHASYQIRANQAALASEARLDEVAKRGRHVMPFNLEQTSHVFTKTETGGIQQVVVKDKANKEQIQLIRQHLSKISGEFAKGDFSNPAKIHGASMPGLKELSRAKQGQIKVAYRELVEGAEIDYATEETNLRQALHQWFDAQLSDHARHAMQGHPHHMMHRN